jgi:CBS domain-containing protein
MMNVSHLIEQREGDVHTCGVNTGVASAASLLAERRIGALPVMEATRVVGVFSERDLLYCIASEGATALNRTVGEVMTAPAITIEPETDVLEALSLMTRRRIRHLPVVRNGRMVGLVSIGDLVKHRLELAEAEAQAMRAYIQTA